MEWPLSKGDMATYKDVRNNIYVLVSFWDTLSFFYYKLVKKYKSLGMALVNTGSNLILFG